jgi:long-chain fatty acid transport protein
MKIPRENLLQAACLAAACAVLASPALATDGYFVQGFGAVNAALGGAATAGNDQDLIGSIYKNPATAVLFPDRTASIVFGDIIPRIRIDSSVTALGLSGSSDSTVNGVPYLSLMANWKSADPDLTWFAGVVSEAGLSFHAATSATNPIFFPQAGAVGNPFGGQFGGFGDVRSTLYVIRIPLGVAGAMPGGWSWGFELAPSVGRNLFTPAAFAPPTLGPDYAPVYATVQQENMELGLGAQGGLRWQVDKDVSFGFSLSSPTWFHTYSWNVKTGTGSPETVTFRMDRPLTAQAGINYAIADSTHIVADLGYIAYGSTPGFENSGFRANGSIAGLGWKDSWTFELGVQHALTKDIVVRAGYNYCSDPIPDSMTFYNVGSPLYISQHLSIGTSVSVAPNVTIDVSYTHGFSHTQSSPWYNPYGAVPGTNITAQVSGDEFAVGTTFRF